MKLFKPGWITHGQSGKSDTANWALYSLDLHPDGSRLATGGMGESGGTVVWWNMRPVRDEVAEKDADQPKKLFQADGRLVGACVNCVRWSPKGQFLASAGDEKIVMIWRLVSNTASTCSSAFGKSETFAETWRCISQLRGHAGDVLDLAWSANGQYLASASVDNTVVVWIAGKWPERAGVLRGHTNMVKGVVWDPVGRYLATQSDDRTVRVWRTSDWSEEAKVAEPFQKCAGHTQVLRLTWSPDGSNLVAAHAVNNGFPTAQVIDRAGWSPSLDLVGHRKHVVCARYNPNLVKSTKTKSDQAVICLALGSKDRSVSVWTTDKRRPLVVVHDLFTSTVIDLTWSSDGQELVCCSLDGTVAFLKFSREEVGIPLTKEELIRLHCSAYGQSHLDGKSNTEDIILETPEALALQQQRKALLAKDARQGLSLVKDSMPSGPRKQLESRTKEGRRRITPKFLGHLESVDENSNPQFTEGSSSGTTKPNITPAPKTTTSAPVPKAPVLPEAHGPPVVPEEGKTPAEDEKTPAEGTTKKKVEVTLVSSLEEESRAPVEKTKSPKKVKHTHEEVVSPSKGKIREKHHIGRGRPRKDKSLHKKRHLEEEERSAKKRRRWAHALEDSDTEAAEDVDTSLKQGSRGVDEALTAKEQVAMSSIPCRPLLPACSLSEGRATSQCGDISVEVISNKESHSVTASRQGNKVWQLHLTQPICALASNSQVIMIGDSRCRLHLVNPTGMRLSPPVVLDAAPATLHCSPSHVMVLTQKGTLRVWSLDPLKQVLKESIDDVIRDRDSLYKSAYLTKDGQPVVQLSNGSAYAFHGDMSAWVELYDVGDSLRAFVASSLVNVPQSGPLASAQLLGSITSSTGATLPHVDANGRRAALLDLLECQVQAAQLLESPQEFRFWMQAWVRHLVEMGEEHRLRVVCEGLLGPVHRSARSSWEDSILGISKRSLLRDLLPLFALNLHLQRLYVELKEQLDHVT